MYHSKKNVALKILLCTALVQKRVVQGHGTRYAQNFWGIPTPNLYITVRPGGWLYSSRTRRKNRDQLTVLRASFKARRRSSVSLFFLAVLLTTFIPQRSCRQKSIARKSKHTCKRHLANIQVAILFTCPVYTIYFKAHGCLFLSVFIDRFISQSHLVIIAHAIYVLTCLL